MFLSTATNIKCPLPNCQGEYPTSYRQLHYLPSWKKAQNMTLEGHLSLCSSEGSRSRLQPDVKVVEMTGREHRKYLAHFANSRQTLPDLPAITPEGQAELERPLRRVAIAETHDMRKTLRKQVDNMQTCKIHWGYANKHILGDEHGHHDHCPAKSHQPADCHSCPEGKTNCHARSWKSLHCHMTFEIRHTFEQINGRSAYSRTPVKSSLWYSTQPNRTYSTAGIISLLTHTCNSVALNIFLHPQLTLDHQSSCH